MRLLNPLLLATVGLWSIGAGAFAQETERMRIRGVIHALDAHEMHISTQRGDEVTVRVPDDVKVTVIEPITIDAVKPGSFIGTAAVPQPDGTLRALEIQVFPEAMRGVGEGHHAWDLGSDSTMTNGTVGSLKIADGRRLTLSYKGGEQVVFVPANVPVITYEPGVLSNLTPGAHVIVTALHHPDETLSATRIAVGKDGLVPPM